MTVYPASVSGHVDPALSRWKWLVKWFLAIPHFVVLAFLWIAFLFTTIAAFFSIVFTGRYPRRIFDFNLGVLRWTWRVQFYAFTFATDRYPPFTLGEAPDYPCRLDIAYPERLSRGLVWVKWWLLAIPHYIVVALFTGGAGVRMGGLTGILALVAGVVLLFRRVYPESIFGFVMGMHRWGWRVCAYAALMRDEYPPFRLDMGPDEPPGPESTPAASPVAA